MTSDIAGPEMLEPCGRVVSVSWTAARLCQAQTSVSPCQMCPVIAAPTCPVECMLPATTLSHPPPHMLPPPLHHIDSPPPPPPPHLLAGACPSSYGSGKKVFCYFEGKRSPTEVDPCPCTHLLYKNVHIDHNSRLRFTDRMFSR